MSRVVTVVCTGNLCRSPMAEAFLRVHLRRRGVDDVRVVSAGTYGLEGHPPMPEAVEAVEEVLRRDDEHEAHEQARAVAAHRSRPLDFPLAERSALILCAAEEHARCIRRWWPELPAAKVRLFNEPIADEAPVDVGDPLGRGREVFVRTARVVERAMAAWADALARQTPGPV